MLNCQADIDNANNLLRDLRWGNTKKRKDGLNPCDHDLTFDCQVNENDRLESIQLKYADGREISLENYECRFKYAVQIAVAVKKIAEGEKPDKQLIPIIRRVGSITLKQ